MVRKGFFGLLGDPFFVYYPIISYQRIKVYRVKQWIQYYYAGKMVSVENLILSSTVVLLYGIRTLWQESYSFERTIHSKIFVLWFDVILSHKLINHTYWGVLSPITNVLYQNIHLLHQRHHLQSRAWTAHQCLIGHISTGYETKSSGLGRGAIR